MLVRIVFLLFLLLPGLSLAASSQVTTPNQFPSTMDVAGDFNRSVPAMIDQTLNSAAYKKLYTTLFLALGAIFIAMNVSKYILGDMNNSQLISALLVLWFVGSAPSWFQVFMDAFLSFSQGVGDVVQQGILGNSNPNYPVEFMFNVTGRFAVDLSWNPLTWLNHLIEIIVLAVVAFLMVLLAMMSVVSALVQSYMFVPLALVGLLVIPFALFPSLGYLFDGWLRSFLVIVFFGIFARITVAVAVFGLSLMFNVHDISDFDGRVFEFSAENIFRLLGAASIALLSLWSVANSYRLAASIVSGAAGSIFGGSGAVSKLNDGLAKMKGG